jgi:hypothetical protein
LQAAKNGELTRIKRGVYATDDHLASQMLDVEKVVPADVKHFLVALGFFLLTIQVSGYHHRIVDGVCNGKADCEYQKWTHIILCFIDDLYSMQWQKCQLRVQSKE